MPELELPVGYGQVAYETYVQHCGGLSIRGEPLPAWGDQSDEIRGHWNAAAQAVSDYLDRIPHG